MRLEPSTAWQVLTPASLAADGGVVLRAAPDGSVLASGPNPGETIYTIEARDLVAARHGGPSRSAAGSVAAEGRTGPRPVRQLPDERHSKWTPAAPPCAINRFAPTTPSAARAWTHSFRRSCRATRISREDGGSTRAARRSGCRGKSCSRSSGRSAHGARDEPAHPVEAPGRGRRTADRPIPAVGHVAGTQTGRGDSRPGCGRFSNLPRRSGPSSSERISRPSTGRSRSR